MIAVAPLVPDRVDSRLAALTFPRYAPLLSADMLAAPWCRAFAAWADGAPVGLALLGRDEDGSWRLLSLVVASAWRRRGVGRALLAAVTAWARDHGVAELTAVHGDTMRGAAAWRALLAAGGWSPPEPYLLSLTGRAPWAAEARAEWAPLFTRLAAQGYGVTPWHDRNAADDAEIDRLSRGIGRLAPSHAGEVLPEVSLVVRRHGRPVGWVLGGQGARPGEIYYPSGWVTAPLQRAGWLVAALVDACLAQQRAFGDDGLCSFQTAGDNRAMRDFMLRRLDRWTVARTAHFLSRWRATD